MGADRPEPVSRARHARRTCLLAPPSRAGAPRGALGAMSGSFEFPFFFSYPPYFTLQPVKDTRERQAALWAALILAYCKHHKLFVLRLDEPLPLFANASIGRALPVEARAAFVGDLVAQVRN